MKIGDKVETLREFVKPKEEEITNVYFELSKTGTLLSLDQLEAERKRAAQWHKDNPSKKKGLLGKAD